MSGNVITRVERAEPHVIDKLAEAGAATIHEAQGRTGLPGSRLRPRFPGARIAGRSRRVSWGSTIGVAAGPPTKPGAVADQSESRKVLLNEMNMITGAGMVRAARKLFDGRVFG